MAHLPADFPHLAVLEKAGEATHAKLRKRIADGTLKDIEGIGDAKAKEVEAAFEKIDTPATQADEMKASEDSNTTPADQAAKQREIQAATMGAVPGEGTVLNEGAVSDETRRAAKAEGDKTGAQKNRDLANHALDQPTGQTASSNAIAASEGERLALSPAVFVDHHAGPFVTKTPMKFGPGERIKVLPIAQVTPQKGMEVRDGDDVYTVSEAVGNVRNPLAWLAVRSPNTGKALVD